MDWRLKLPKTLRNDPSTVAWAQHVEQILDDEIWGRTVNNWPTRDAVCPEEEC